MNSIKISQSLIKAWEKHTYGKLCGLLLEGLYIKKNVETLPSEAMAEGIFFEYLCTGAKSRSGEIPQPVYDTKGRLSTNYQRIVVAADFFKKIIAAHGIKILKTGLSVDAKIGGVPCTGIFDVWAEWNNRKCIIDIKYSGLIDDKWSPLGWHEDNMSVKPNLTTQGLHYTMLAENGFGIPVGDVDFFYFIFNSKDPMDMKIFQQEVSEERRLYHSIGLEKIYKIVSEESLPAFPSYRMCRHCAMFDGCDKKHTIPQPEIMTWE